MDFTFDKPQAAPARAWASAINDPEMKARYAKAPDVIRTVVERERAKHLPCATDEKPLRVDVERIVTANTCYLEFTCPGCFKVKRIQLNEKTGVEVIMKDVIDKTLAPVPVVNPMTKAERIAANVKANVEARARYPQISIPPSWVEKENRLIRDTQFRAYSSVQPLRFTAESFEYDEEIFENDGEVKKSAKPLISGGGKIKRKPEPKQPKRSMLDRLRIVRAMPAEDEEV